ncbi:hypothetical protein PTKIN_Ptkin16aG0547600 [Pterospermum kingtungense]
MHEIIWNPDIDPDAVFSYIDPESVRKFLTSIYLPGNKSSRFQRDDNQAQAISGYGGNRNKKELHFAFESAGGRWVTSKLFPSMTKS